jgi:hypothetical protein
VRGAGAAELLAGGGAARAGGREGGGAAGGERVARTFGDAEVVGEAAVGELEGRGSGGRIDGDADLDLPGVAAAADEVAHRAEEEAVVGHHAGDEPLGLRDVAAEDLAG